MDEGEKISRRSRGGGGEDDGFVYLGEEEALPGLLGEGGWLRVRNSLCVEGFDQALGFEFGVGFAMVLRLMRSSSAAGGGREGVAGRSRPEAAAWRFGRPVGDRPACPPGIIWKIMFYLLLYNSRSSWGGLSRGEISGSLQPRMARMKNSTLDKRLRPIPVTLPKRRK